jgi:hypothetical protein
MQFGLLHGVGFSKSHDPIVLFVHVAGHPADRPPFARGVPTVEQDDHLFTGALKMLLHLDQLSLIGFEFLSRVILDQGRLDYLPFMFFLEDRVDAFMIVAVHLGITRLGVNSFEDGFDRFAAALAFFSHFPEPII